ncbi:MAG: bifunctional hydroxymethylpyrimidine kinase/phosphomethylpyrimidine kinase [Clostridiales bacterium]|nr:bifunctional hydroxymethylpyrimidine kinase/phosphomethylpyrimidine kinase [Clostridiales bacterium]
MKNILIFNDISGLGNCSMSANLPIFTKLGHYSMPIVTGNYSCQTGFDGFLVSKNDRVAEFAANLMRYRTPDAVYVGFCNDTDTLQGVHDVLSRLLSKENGVFVLVDPIMGDNGKLYSIFDGKYVAQMKKTVSNADCITPNLTEACLLADIDYAELTSHKEKTFLAYCGKVFADFLCKVGCKSAVITGIECGALIGNIVLDGDKLSYVTNERVDVTYSGTGDVFSSVIAGLLLNGYKLTAATQVAANFVEKAARASECKDRRFGIEFARVLDLL